MNIYNVTFEDGSRASVNATTSDEAIRTAMVAHGKTVTSVSEGKKVELQPPSAEESLSKGGPNF